MSNSVQQPRYAAQCCPPQKVTALNISSYQSPHACTSRKKLNWPSKPTSFWSIFYFPFSIIVETKTEIRDGIINKPRCIKLHKLLCIMVNRIHHWLSGKEKYGRHYCLASTGFAGQPRVLSGSEYKSKTEDERRLVWPPEKRLRPGVLGSSWVRLPLLLFCFKYISFLPPLPLPNAPLRFRSKKHNPVICFTFYVLCFS